jgi:hypothetical protein
MVTEKLNIDKIREVINKNSSGFTLNLNSYKLVKNGYAVGITNNAGNNNLIILLQKIQNGINLFPQMKTLYIGGWLDNGLYYLDLSLIFKKKENALIFMTKFNQKALFDIKNQQLIKNPFYKPLKNE